MMKSSLALKKIGIWTGGFEPQPASKLKEAVAELEQLGYGAVWYSEGLGRESLTQAGLLLSGSSHIVVATGITNIYGRDPVTMARAQKTLSEAYPDRFVLGLGVSHIPLVERLRGHAYEKPVAKMTDYLDAMDKAPYNSVPPASTYRVLAALGPKMLELAGKRTDGAHTYNVTPEHTATARKILGAGPWLCVEQAVVLESDAAKAREIARAFLALLPHSAELHEQLSAFGVYRRRLQGRRQRSPDRCHRRLGRDGCYPRRIRSPSICGRRSRLHPGAHRRLRIAADQGMARVGRRLDRREVRLRSAG